MYTADSCNCLTYGQSVLNTIKVTKTDPATRNSGDKVFSMLFGCAIAFLLYKNNRIPISKMPSDQKMSNSLTCFLS